MIRSHWVAVFSVVVLALTACTSSSDPTTTSSSIAPVTTLASSTTVPETVPETTTTLAPIDELSGPSYRIVERVSTDGSGDEVVVLLDPASYESLTDLDLYDLIAEVVELYPPISVVHVVDSAAAANVVANPDATDADRESVAEDYLARLDDGNQITYLGPFAASGSAVLGS